MYLKKQTLFLFLLCAFLLFSSPAVADRVDRQYQKAARKFHELYRDTSFREKADNWIKTIKQFQLIYQNYPRHARASQSLYNIGRLYRSLFKWNSKTIYLDKSNITFRRLVKGYPNSTLADDAQYLLAENYELFKKEKNLAYLEYHRLITLYPNSLPAQKARLKIKDLRPPHKDLQIKPEVRNAVKPIDLTVLRYGGLSKEKDDKTRPLVLVSKVDYWSTSDWSRMVINTKKEVRYKYQVLKEDRKHKQKRMYLDISHAYLPNVFKRKIASNDGLINQARIAQFDKKTVRIVLDFASLEKIKVFNFKLPNQNKIVIDILGKAAVENLRVTEREPIPSGTGRDPDSQWVETPSTVSLSKALGLKVKRIILDPGHGGKDPGACAFKVKEKRIALNICLALKKIINERDPDLKVILTRANDRFIQLEERTAFANKNKGDLFLSIHLNASPRPRLRGTETYYLNLTSDNDALSLAAKENQTSLKSISDLQTILNDLMTNSKIGESRTLAQKIQASIIDVTRGSAHKQRDLGVKRAPFIVLFGAQMPSVLIEAGFLTNRTENRFLKKKSYQHTIAVGIYNGIKSYID
jgi:N-acetylmuramoyl-L-alanine amidase